MIAKTPYFTSNILAGMGSYLKKSPTKILGIWGSNLPLAPGHIADTFKNIKTVHDIKPAAQRLGRIGGAVGLDLIAKTKRLMDPTPFPIQILHNDVTKISNLITE
jgi:hypothetical protein